jgi:hypothetical protein
VTNSNPANVLTIWQESWDDWMRAWTGLAQPLVQTEPPPPTPGEAWKRSMDRWLNAWSTFLEDVTTRPSFATAAGQTLNRVLDVQKPLREQTEATMQRWLEWFNMPSRSDLIRLARQVNEVNARLDDLGDRVEEIEDRLAVQPKAEEPKSSNGNSPARAGRTA